MRHWYTLHTKPNAECQVAAVLDERGIEVYLPMVRRKWRSTWRELPFFPNYLFARFSLDEIGYSAVAWTPGLRRVVAFGNQPATMPDEAVNMIRERLERITATGGLPTHGFQPGDEVRFTKGPLEGLHAVFEGPMTPTDRVQVLIRFLGQVNRAEVPVEELERVRERERRPHRPRRTRGRGRVIRQSRRQDRDADRTATS
jgi:transcriptional antiterminator RfaH